MKRLLLLIAFCCLPAWSQCPTTSVSLGGGFTCVISHQGSGGSGSQTVTYSGGHTAGDVIVVVGSGNFSGSSWVLGNIANTLSYTWVAAQTGCAGASQGIYAWKTVVPSTTATSDTITLTNANYSFIIENSFEISGSSGVLDGTGAYGTSGSGSGSFSFGSTSLPIGTGVGSATQAAGTGWTAIGFTSASPYSVSEYISPGGTSANATFTGAAYTCAIGFALKPTAAATCTPTPQLGVSPC